MKILVLSDSHSALRGMRSFVQAIAPDAVVHLGDYFEDGQVLREEFPQIAFYQVPGNCDRYRCPPGQPEILAERVCGVELYMTHGHRQRVKSGIGNLLHCARDCRVDAVLYGHTHCPDCHQEPDGLWVLNPGSCGYGGTAGLIFAEQGKITNCCLLRESDLLAHGGQDS